MDGLFGATNTHDAHEELEHVVPQLREWRDSVVMGAGGTLVTRRAKLRLTELQLSVVDASCWSW